jgi:glycerol-3-phosphate acyltransferase PlsY
MPYLLAALAIALAYVIGSVPFAYLIVRWKKGIDIRTFGSGNVGATNAGRILGFRYFLIVFALDLAKGYLPTWGFPELLKTYTGVEIAGLNVLIAVATILGHNYTLFLRFRGGKGVATSLGAVTALDSVASVGAAAVFLIVLLMTRYVSMGSVLGGVAFAVVHFARVDDPWSREHFLMSVAVIGLLAMLIARHRQNLVRIGAGTESKVSFRKKKPAPPQGKIGPVALLLLAAVGAGIGVTYYTTKAQSVDCGAFSLKAVDRVGTGHQRAERVLFLDEGRRLAVTCPRYNRVQMYRVDSRDQMILELDFEVEGKPVALASHGKRLFVLQRPSGDARHVEEGYLEIFDRTGKPLGSKIRIGFDPDDLAVTSDGAWAYVLNSGNAEGESNRPDPAILSIRLGGDVPAVIDRREFSGPGDDPERLRLAEDAKTLAVSIRGSDRRVEIAVNERGEFAKVPRAVSPISPGVVGREFAIEPRGPRFFATVPDDSAVEVFDAGTSRSLGRLPLRGAANLSPVRPMGIDYSAERGLIAVGSRNGAVHLVKIEEERSARR